MEFSTLAAGSGLAASSRGGRGGFNDHRGRGRGARGGGGRGGFRGGYGGNASAGSNAARAPTGRDEIADGATAALAFVRLARDRWLAGGDVDKAVHELGGPNNQNWMKALRCTDYGQPSYLSLMDAILEVAGNDDVASHLERGKTNKIYAPLMDGTAIAGINTYMAQVLVSNGLPASGTDHQADERLRSKMRRTRLLIGTFDQLLDRFPDSARLLPLQVLKSLGVDTIQLSAPTSASASAGDASGSGALAAELKFLQDRMAVLTAKAQARLTGIAQHSEAVLTRLDQERRGAASGAGGIDVTAYRTLPVIPRPEDILGDRPAVLPRNRERGAFASVDEYLNTHFMLLREDCLVSLRDGIAAYRRAGGASGAHAAQAAASSGVKVYMGVVAAQPVFGRNGLAYLMRFTTTRKLRWASSRRLMPGCLVVLTPDNFITVVLATVHERRIELLEDPNGPFIALEIAPGYNAAFDFQASYTMVECPVFFEAYRPVLESMQNMPQGEDKLPFASQLLGRKATTAQPSYLLLGETTVGRGDRSGASGAVLPQHPARPRRLYKMAAVFPSFKADTGRDTQDMLEADWPPVETSLDASQLEALKRCLTADLAVVQGPPGCGKTFVGVQATKLLLANHECRSRKPLVFVCFTNHALDQMLEHVLEFEPNIIRIGGQSKSERMKSLSLHEARQKVLGNSQNRREMAKLISERGEVEKTLRFVFATSAAHVDRLTDRILPGIERHFPAQVGSLYSRYHLVADTDTARDEVDADGFQTVTGKKQRKQRVQLVDRWLHLDRPRPRMGSAHQSFHPHQPQSLCPSAREVAVGRAPLGAAGAGGATTGSNAAAGAGAGADHSEVDGSLEADGEVEDDEAEIARELDERHIDDGGDDSTADGAGGGAQHRQPNQAQDDAMAAAFNLQMEAFLRSSGNRGSNVQPLQIDSDDEYEGGQRHLTDEQLTAVEDVWKLSVPNRRRLADLWLRTVKQKGLEAVGRLTKQYNELSKQIAVLNDMLDAAALRGAKVIGLTTTGAAKYRSLLHLVDAEVLIVEEAAEVLEAHILSAFTPGLKHLILIGDHEQLRPKTEVYALRKKNHLDVSLFERLIHNGLPRTMLTTQHRMRPEIARLVSPVIYPILNNHPDVLAYPHVQGMSKDLYAITHSQRELGGDDELPSKSNPWEAAMSVAIVKYLMRNKYSPSRIVVLTMYTGQLLDIKRRLKAEEAKLLYGLTGISHVRVSTVDNYQGEESDIIILTTVRSNNEGSIGFLAESNRVCVALSRARHGMYILGNVPFLAAKDRLWGMVQHELQETNAIGPTLQLSCQRHAGRVTNINRPEDFVQVADGGCSEPCGERLDCGHECPMRCHSDGHDGLHCMKPCNKTLECGHRCPKLCHAPCNPCTIVVQKVVPKCGHTQQMPCHQSADTWICKMPCQKPPLSCGHKCPRSCGQECVERCMVPMMRTLPCGHQQSLHCYVDVAAVQCRVECPTKLACGHQCSGDCSGCRDGQHQVCDQPCKRKLPCGHECKTGHSCATGCPPCQLPCATVCAHSKCNRKCGDPCQPCMEPCTTGCQHQKCKLLCHQPCIVDPCNERCKKRLPCGHQCAGLCGETCPKHCTVCNADEMDSIMGERFGDCDFEAGERLFTMPQCKHTLLLSTVDNWMRQCDPRVSAAADADGGAASSSSAAPRKISLPTCPQCTTVVRQSRRYSSIIKACTRQIETMKEQTYMLALPNSVRRLLKDGKYDEAESSVRKALESSFLQSAPRARGQYLLALVLARRKPTPRYDDAVRILSELAPHLKAMLQQRGLVPATSSSARSSSVAGGPSTTATASSAGRRSTAARAMSAPDQDLLRLYADVILLWAMALRGVNGGPSSSSQTSVKSLLLEYKEVVALLPTAPRGGAPLSGLDLAAAGDDEAAFDVDAYLAVLTINEGFGQPGHWFTCPNGHPYVIGECGGAMETGTCPECSAAIGGGGHALLGDNRHAGAFDGSSMGAYDRMMGINPPPQARDGDF